MRQAGSEPEIQQENPRVFSRDLASTKRSVNHGSTKFDPLPLQVPPQALEGIRMASRLTDRTTASLHLSGPLDFDQSWRLVGNALALPKSDFRDSFGEIITTQTGFVIFSSEGSSLNHLDTERGRPVLYNSDRRSFGILSGTLIVRLKYAEEAHTWAKEYGLTVIHVQDSINKAFFSIPSQTDITRLNKELKTDSRVSEYELEILSGLERRQ